MSEINWWLFTLCFLGAFILAAQLHSEGKTSLHFIEILAPSWQSGARHLLDTLLFCIVGAVVSYFITGPATERQAIAGGLGWTALIGSFSRRKSARSNKSKKT